MTFREKLAQEHPDFLNDAFDGGCANCPRHYGYEEISPAFCGDANDEMCRKCWDREMPVIKPMTQEEQERHDREINAEIIWGYCKDLDCTDCPAEAACHHVGGMWSALDYGITKQLNMLRAFEDALPQEEEEEEAPADDCTTCLYSNKDDEDYPCNECCDYDHWTIPKFGFGTEALLNPNLNVYRHKKICEELNALYERKNADYGDSFHRSYLDWGLPMAAIRLGDKYNRFVSLVKSKGEAQVKDESIRDTLIDLANYAIMTVMELDDESGGRF